MNFRQRHHQVALLSGSPMELIHIISKIVWITHCCVSLSRVSCSCLKSIVSVVL